jgi:hypothetical protein
MLALIHLARSVRSILAYNERKVKRAEASCLYAENFFRDAAQLSATDKWDHLHRFERLNQRARFKAVHVSLNFASNRQFSSLMMTLVASEYMEQQGLGNQPYLVYRHFDAGHPHLHLVSTLINREGNRIAIPKLGRASGDFFDSLLQLAPQPQIAPAEKNILDGFANRPQRLRYGQASISSSIAEIARHLIREYKICSMEEWKALLQEFRVAAEVRKGISPYRNDCALVYGLIDERGRKKGIPLPAGSLPFPASLPYLRNLFRKNADQREAYRQPMIRRINGVLAARPTEWGLFCHALREEQIQVKQQSRHLGGPSHITFIDFRNKTVFSQEALGDGFTEEGIRKKIEENRRIRRSSLHLHASDERSDPLRSHTAFRQALSRP